MVQGTPYHLMTSTFGLVALSPLSASATVCDASKAVNSSKCPPSYNNGQALAAFKEAKPVASSRAELGIVGKLLATGSGVEARPNP